MGISGDAYRAVDPDDVDETIVGTSPCEGAGEADLASTHSSEVPVFDPDANVPVSIPRPPRSLGADDIPIFSASEPRLPSKWHAAIDAENDPRGIEADEEASLSETAEWRVPPRPRSADLVGKIVAGRYVLGRVLGEGGMGTVFEAEHADLGRKVAIKVLAPMFDGHGEATARFLREAKAASTIDSEHIAQVFDIGEDFHLGLYMVMEILRGDDLSRVLAERGKLQPELAAGIAWQVCLALERAHDAGVAHRDLKPGNVYLTRGDDGSVKVKVLDFGIAKLLRDARSPRGGAITGSGMVIGTPQYMSPEQAQGLATVDHRTDIYALGALLFECIAGAPPYAELETYEQTLFKIISEPPPPLSARAPGVPPALGALVSELMAREPARRPSSARAVRERLAAIFPALGKRTVVFGGSAPSVPTPVPPRTGSGITVDSTIGRSAPPPPRTVHPAVVGALAATVIAAMTAAITIRFEARPTDGVGSGVVTSAGSALRATETQAATVAPSPTTPAAPAPPATGVTALVSQEREAADLVARAQRALERQDADDARDLAREATRRAPNNAEAWLTLGAAFEALGDVASARTAYDACKTQADGDHARECAALLAR